MRALVYLAQFRHRYVRVHRRRVQAAVPEHQLDVMDVCAVVEHFRCHRVPEQVTCAGLGHADLLEVAAHDHAQRGVGHRRAAIAQEQRALVRIDQKFWTQIRSILFDPAAGALADRHHAILAALALVDAQRTVLRVHVIHRKLRALEAADTGRVQRFDDRPIA